MAFLVFCNLLVPLSHIFSVLSRISVLPYVQPVLSAIQTFVSTVTLNVIKKPLLRHGNNVDNVITFWAFSFLGSWKTLVGTTHSTSIDSALFACTLFLRIRVNLGSRVISIVCIQGWHVCPGLGMLWKLVLTRVHAGCSIIVAHLSRLLKELHVSGTLTTYE